MGRRRLLGESLLGEIAEDPIARGTVVTQLGAGSTAAQLNAALAAAALTASERNEKIVELGYGDFAWEAQILRPSYVYIKGQGSGTRCTATWTAGADDPDAGAMIKSVGTLDTATVNTTLTARAVKGQYTISVNSATGITANMFLNVNGNNGGDDMPAMSDGTSVVLSEIVQVASSYVSGTTIPLNAPLAQVHGTGVAVRRVIPVQGGGVCDMTLRGSQGGVTTAVGVLHRYAIRTKVSGIFGEGFSRAGIEMDAVHHYTSPCYWNWGNTNCWYFLSSTFHGDVSGFAGADGVARVHASGIPRGAFFMRRRNTNVRIHHGQLNCGAWGLFHAGGVHCKFEALHIRNMDLTQSDYDRWVNSGEHLNGGNIGVGLGSGPAPLTLAEFAFDCTYTDIIIEDLTAPGTAGWADSALYRARAWYFHDSRNVLGSNVHCVNSNAVSNVAGPLCSDSEGVLPGLMVKGHNHGWTMGNFYVDVKLTDYRYDGVNAGGGATGSFAFVFLYNPTGGRGLDCDGVHATNYNGNFLFVDASQAYDGNMEIKNLINDDGQWSYAQMGISDGTNFAKHDIGALDGAYTGTERRIKTPTAGQTSGLVSIIVGGTGKIIYCPLTAEVAFAKKESAALIEVGEGVEAAGANRRLRAATGAANCGVSQVRAQAAAETIIRIGRG